MILQNFMFLLFFILNINEINLKNVDENGFKHAIFDLNLTTVEAERKMEEFNDFLRIQDLVEISSYGIDESYDGNYDNTQYRCLAKLTKEADNYFFLQAQFFYNMDYEETKEYVKAKMYYYNKSPFNIFNSFFNFKVKSYFYADAMFDYGLSKEEAKEYVKEKISFYNIFDFGHENRLTWKDQHRCPGDYTGTWEVFRYQKNLIFTCLKMEKFLSKEEKRFLREKKEN